MDLHPFRRRFDCALSKMPDWASSCNGSEGTRIRTNVAISPVAQLGLCRPIKNIRFTVGDNGAKRGAVNPRSEAEPQGAEASTARVWCMRRAELHKRD